MNMPPRRGRQRVGAAARKIAERASAAQLGEADRVGLGVRDVVRAIDGSIEPGSAYWRGPLQYVAEQMAPRVAKEHGIPDGQLDDLRAYLLAGLNEFVIAMAADFDPSHLATWLAGMAEREARG